MSKRSVWAPAALSFILGSLFIGTGLAVDHKYKLDPVAEARKAAQDPRSGAALNLEAAKRAARLGLLKSRSGTSSQSTGTPRRIHHSTVNNPAADTTAQDTQSETTIVDLGGGDLVAAFNDSGSFAPGTNHFTGYAFSTDGGLSWSDPGTLPNSAEGDAGDPVLANHNASGSVYLSTLGFTTGENIQVFKSVDQGKTWGAPVNGTPGFGGSGNFQDKEWMTVDNFAGPGNGNVYLCWTRFFGSSAEIRFTRSIDGGATFGPNLGVLLSTGGQGCFVVVAPNHVVHVFYYRGTGPGGQGGDNKIFTRRSLDQGVTFQAEVQVADLNTTTTNGNLQLNGGLRSNSFPHAAVNPVGARPFLYVVFNDDPNLASSADNGNIRLTHSTDGGATWSAPITVNTDDQLNDQFFPTIAFRGAGERLMISYYSRSQDPSNFMFHRRAHLGLLNADGSVNFPSGTFQLSPNTPIAIGQDPVINPVYMGDYDQIAARGNWLSATWSDNRLGNSFHKFQPDVRFARINAVAQSLDLSAVVTRSPATIALGENTTLRVTVSAATRTANDVFVNLSPTFGLAYRSAFAGGVPCTLINQFIGCYLGQIAAGTSKRIDIVATGVHSAGTRTVRAKATTSGRDTNLANNLAAANVSIVAGSTTTHNLSTGNIAVPINDFSTVDIPVGLGAEGTAVRLIPRIRLNHTFDADLDIRLISPTGKSIELSTRNGGSGDNYGSGANDCSGTKTVFDDAAATSIVSGAPPFAGTFRPEQSLADLLGEPTDGVWKLRIADVVGGDTGTLGCFQLTIVRTP